MDVRTLPAEEEKTNDNEEIDYGAWITLNVQNEAVCVA